MSTLLGSMNALGTGPNSRPSHPVDAALWGLAERLAGGPEPTQTETIEPGHSGEHDSYDHRTSQVRVVRLPQRAGGLPSVGRMGQRNRTAVAPAVGVPTKPITAESVPASKPAALPGKSSRRKPSGPQKTTPQIRRAEFTILKGRNGERSASPKSDENSEIRQESAATDENPSGARTNARRRTSGKRRAGVTIFGWLALTAFAVVAAAIALFAPSWF
jgi:hypothetical protein